MKEKIMNRNNIINVGVGALLLAIVIVANLIAFTMWRNITVQAIKDGISSISVGEQAIWVEPKDYNKMTKSEINNYLANVKKLITVAEECDLEELFNQASNEYNNGIAHLKSGDYLYPYTDEDYLLLAYMIEQEAGTNIITDEEQCLVGCVILNRRNQGGINKNLKNATIKDVINEPGQYSICKYSKSMGKNSFYVDLNSVNTSKVSARCRENAIKVLEGKFTCPPNVLFQALFTQGKVYKQFGHGAPLNNTTYFCYG